MLLLLSSNCGSVRSLLRYRLPLVINGGRKGRVPRPMLSFLSKELKNSKFIFFKYAIQHCISNMVGATPLESKKKKSGFFSEHPV